MGYENIEALEPSENLIEMAKKANIYKRYIGEPVLPDRKIDVAEGKYIHFHRHQEEASGTLVLRIQDMPGSPGSRHNTKPICRFSLKILD